MGELQKIDNFIHHKMVSSIKLTHRSCTEYS